MVFGFNAAGSERSPDIARTAAPRVSHMVLGSSIALLEWTLIVFGSLFGQVVYQWVSGKVAVKVDTGVGIGVLAGLIYVYLAYSTGMYRLMVLLDPVRYLRRIMRTCVLALASLTAVLFLLKISTELSRGASVAFGGILLSLCAISRLGVAGAVRTLLDRDAIAGRPVFVLGEPGELARLPPGYMLQQFGIQEVGRYPLERLDAADANLRLDAFREALALSRVSNAKEFLVVAKWDDPNRLAEIDQALRLSPLRVRLLPNHVFRTAMARSTSNGDIASRLIELQRAPLSVQERLSKRVLDLAVASFALIAIAPILVTTAIAIKLDSPGPVIFRQRRNGFNQKQFVIYKFRTMNVLEDGEAVVQARRNDNRITRIGGVLRRSSIDELPQLFNVLKGEMSLVGPRPHALAHDDEYTDQIDDYCMRHHVKPGITGWAQINGYRGETARRELMERRVELDLWYINNRSLLLDLRILFLTGMEILKHDAY